MIYIDFYVPHNVLNRRAPERTSNGGLPLSAMWQSWQKWQSARIVLLPRRISGLRP
jgi:hypothetical protein